MLAALVSSCFDSRQATKPVSVVKNVDLNKYQGKWYEIARFPHFFQRGCVASTAEYKIIDATHVSVKNTCYIENLGKKQKEIFGKAEVVDGSNGAKLKVRFDKFPANLFAGDYWITMLDENYNWAVVTDSSGEYLWVLARTPKMTDATYNHIYSELIKKGFKVEFLKAH
jgi:apolipoprotein D and lipocalin family protein